MEQGGDTCPALVRCCCDDWYGRCRNPFQHIRMHDYRTGHGQFQCSRIASIVEEANLVRPSRLQRRDAGKAFSCVFRWIVNTDSV